MNVQREQPGMSKRCVCACVYRGKDMCVCMVKSNQRSVSSYWHLSLPWENSKSSPPLPPSVCPPVCVCVCLPIKDLYVYSNCGGQSGDIIYCYCCWLSLSTHTNTQHSFFHYFRNHTYTGTLWQHKFFYSRTRTNMVACKTRTHQCLHLHIKSFNTETKPAQTALIEENTHPHLHTRDSINNKQCPYKCTHYCSCC